MGADMFERLKKLPIEKILAGLAVFVLLFVISLATYDKVGQQEVMIQVKLDSNIDPFLKLPQIMPDYSTIKNVRQVNNNEYMVTVRTRKKKKDVLDWIRSCGGVEDAKMH